MKIDFTLKDFIKYVVFIGIFYSLLQLIPTQPINKKDMLLIVVIASIVFIIFDYYSCVELLTNVSKEDDDVPVDPAIKAKFDAQKINRNLQSDSSGQIIFKNNEYPSNYVKDENYSKKDDVYMIEDEYKKDNNYAKRTETLAKLDEINRLLQKKSLKDEYKNKKNTWDNFTKNLSPELQLIIKEKNMKAELYSDFINSELSWNDFVKTLSPELQTMINNNNNNIFGEYNSSKQTWDKFLSTLSPELQTVIKIPSDLKVINDNISEEDIPISEEDIHNIPTLDTKSYIYRLKNTMEKDPKILLPLSFRNISIDNKQYKLFIPTIDENKNKIIDLSYIDNTNKYYIPVNDNVDIKINDTYYKSVNNNIYIKKLNTYAILNEPIVYNKKKI